MYFIHYRRKRIYVVKARKNLKRLNTKGFGNIIHGSPRNMQYILNDKINCFSQYAIKGY